MRVGPKLLQADPSHEDSKILPTLLPVSKATKLVVGLSVGFCFKPTPRRGPLKREDPMYQERLLRGDRSLPPST